MTKSETTLRREQIIVGWIFLILAIIVMGAAIVYFPPLGLIIGACGLFSLATVFLSEDDDEPRAMVDGDLYG